MDKSHVITFLPPKKPDTLGQWGSCLTSLLTGGDCHACFVLDKPWILNAGWYIEKTNLHKICVRNKYAGYRIFTVTYEGYDHDKAVKYARTLDGKLYDIFKWWSVAKKLILGLFGKKPKTKHDADDMLMCQEMVQQILQAGNCPMNTDWEYPLHIQKYKYLKEIEVVIL